MCVLRIIFLRIVLKGINMFLYVLILVNIRNFGEEYSRVVWMIVMFEL